MSTGWLSEPDMNTRDTLHEIIEIGNILYLNISRACTGHCLVLFKVRKVLDCFVGHVRRNIYISGK